MTRLTDIIKESVFCKIFQLYVITSLKFFELQIYAEKIRSVSEFNREGLSDIVWFLEI